MKIAIFCHSLVSDWNHGNAHFLRGIVGELQARDFEVKVYEPQDAWSRINLVSEYGSGAEEQFEAAFPTLKSTQYDPAKLRCEEWLDGVDLAIAHEWNEPHVIAALGDYRRRNQGLKLLFHDTHHRALTAAEELSRFDLTEYDGVLAYGESLREVYRRHGWGANVYVWHEAADARTFYPRSYYGEKQDLVWIGNWGDEERTEELREFLIEPARDLALTTNVYGVRYPAYAQRELAEAGIHYGGWMANFRVPDTFARHRVTVHVPRRPYTQGLPGIPTIRPFEALACGIPLISAPWEDAEDLFREGVDYLKAATGARMKSLLRDVLSDAALAASLSRHGIETIRARHTCAHRVDELLRIYEGLRAFESPKSAVAMESV